MAFSIGVFVTGWIEKAINTLVFSECFALQKQVKYQLVLQAGKPLHIFCVHYAQ